MAAERLKLMTAESFWRREKAEKTQELKVYIKKKQMDVSKMFLRTFQQQDNFYLQLRTSFTIDPA